MFEQILEPVKAEAEQTLVTAVGAVNETQTTLTQDLNAEKNEPEVGQTGGNKQIAETVGVSKVALVQLKTATLLIGKEGLHPATACIEGASLRRQLHVGDEVDRGIVLVSPPGDNLERAIGGLLRKQNVRQGQHIARLND